MSCFDVLNTVRMDQFGRPTKGNWAHYIGPNGAVRKYNLQWLSLISPMTFGIIQCCNEVAYLVFPVTKTCYGKQKSQMTQSILQERNGIEG